MRAIEKTLCQIGSKTCLLISAWPHFYAYRTSLFLKRIIRAVKFSSFCRQQPLLILENSQSFGRLKFLRNCHSRICCNKHYKLCSQGRSDPQIHYLEFQTANPESNQKVRPYPEAISSMEHSYLTHWSQDFNLNPF